MDNLNASTLLRFLLVLLTLMNAGFSPLFTNKTEAAEGGPQISVEHAKIVQGLPLTVNFSGSTSAKDWIGVYDEQPGSRIWKYVNSDSHVAGTAVVNSGSVHFSGAETSTLKLGPHSIRLLANDSSTNVMVSIAVEVIAPTRYTVTFDSQGGSAVAPITVISGNSIAVPAAPTKEGDSFSGWYKDAGLTDAWNFSTDKVLGDITLYAKWTNSASTGENMILKIMTLNTAVGGQNSSPAAVAEAVKTAGADIVGIQEPFGSVDIFKQVTGFYYNDRLGILSRYPIIDNGQRDYVYVEVRPGEVAAISNVHLQPAPYWPYQLRDQNVTPETAVIGEHNSRMTDMAGRFHTLPELASRNVPVFLTGDFNNPSHLDWTDSTKESHFGYVVEWPVSKKLEQLGFRDSYRDIHPDPAAKPAYTWTPGHPIGTVSPDEVHDRIDFIFAGGPAATRNSRIVGETGPYTDLAIDPWVSDHRAVLSEFEVVPAPRSVLELDPAPVYATLTPGKETYAQGETIKIAYTESTRNFDIVAVYPADQAPIEPSKVFKYTVLDSATLAGPIKPNGQVTFDSTVLEPGTYKAYLFANRGTFILAETTFRVESGPTVTPDKTKVKLGDTLTAAYTGSSSALDWIGLFKQQESGRSVGDDFNDPGGKSDLSVQGAIRQDGVLKATDGKFAIQPDGQYDNFAVTFDIVDYVSWGGWLGLAFGMPSAASNYYDVGSNLFFFQIDRNPRVITYDAPGGTALQFFPMEQRYRLDQKSEPLNVKLVFEDGELRGYWKLPSEPDSELMEPKASWTGLTNKLGYMRFVVDGTPNFSLDNVMIYKDPNNLELDPPIAEGITAPEKIIIGQPYTIEFGGSTGKTDWVAITNAAGIYQQGDAPHWYYVSNHSRTVPTEAKQSGIVTFTAEQTAQLSPGPMQVRFYPNDTTEATIIIDVVAEELDREDLAWKYVGTDNPNGSVTFSIAEIAALEAGNVYAVRLMSNDSNTKVLDSVTLSIGEPDVDGIKSLITEFRALDWIDNDGIANSLKAKLEQAEFHSLMKELQAQSGKHITEKAAFILSRNVQYLMK